MPLNILLSAVRSTSVVFVWKIKRSLLPFSYVDRVKIKTLIRSAKWICLSESYRIIESSEFEGMLKGHLVQLPCNEQGHLQLHQIAQSLIQADLEHLQGQGIHHLGTTCSTASPPFTVKLNTGQSFIFFLFPYGNCTLYFCVLPVCLLSVGFFSANIRLGQVSIQNSELELFTIHVSPVSWKLL